MERESFDDAATAAVMNELFVNVKVDREERPDVDAVYMDAVVALTGQGGWPLTVFLTPDGEPFYGGTYFPPEPRHGLPAFRQVLHAVADAYRERPEDVAAQAGALVDALRRSAETEPSREPLTEALLAEAERGLVSQLDPRWGGFGRAPKFPPASVLEFLLRMAASDGGEAAAARPKTARAFGARPVMSRLGCNAGTCHGSAKGQERLQALAPRLRPDLRRPGPDRRPSALARVNRGRRPTTA